MSTVHPYLIGTREESEQYDTAVPTTWKIVAALRLKNPSATLKQLGEAVGYNAQSIARWIKEPQYQRYENWLLRSDPSLHVPLHLEIAQRSSRERINAMVEERAPEMMERLLSLVETTDDPKLQKEIASDILAMAGVGARKQQDNRQFQLVLTRDVMAEFMQKAAEAFDPPDTVEGEVA